MSSTAARCADAPPPTAPPERGPERPLPLERLDPGRYVSDESFRALVAADVKGEASAGEKALLRRPEAAQRWHDALVALNKELEAQFAERRAAAERKKQECLKRGSEGKGEWFAFRAQHNAWRAGANRFKSKVESSLAECKRLMREARPDRTSSRKVHEDLSAYRHALREVRDFLSEEAAVAPDKQGARRELLQLVGGVLRDPALRDGPVGGAGE